MSVFWTSAHGVPVDTSGVDELALSAMYAAEGSTSFDVAYYAADDSTRYAWRYGYLDPRAEES